MDVALTLAHLVPQADFLGSLTANSRAEFDAIDWRDARDKPSWAQMQAAEAAALAAYEAAQPVTAVDALAEALRAKGVITKAEADAVKEKKNGK